MDRSDDRDLSAGVYKLLDDASARVEREAVEAVLALQRPGAVTIADPRFPKADIRFSLPGEEHDEQLYALAVIVDAVVTIENYTAEPLALPATISLEQSNLIVQIGQLVRTQAFEGQIGDEYVMPAADELLAGLQAGTPFVVQEEKGIAIFGRTVWLGLPGIHDPGLRGHLGRGTRGQRNPAAPRR